jgi:hypothetical protein
MVGKFCVKERALRFEESYELQGMFAGGAYGASTGIEELVRDEVKVSDKVAEVSSVREL